MRAVARRSVVALGVTFATGLAVAHAQFEGVEQSFEVVSIRVVEVPATRTYRRQVTPDRWSATNIPLVTLIQQAYSLPLDRITGMPGWAVQAYFDIDAKTSRPVSPEEMRPMLRALLRDRFGLRAGLEHREVPVLALTIVDPGGRLGPGLQPSTFDCSAFRERELEFSRARAGQIPRNSDCELATERANGQVVLKERAFPIVTLPGLLGSWLQRPVIDRTGLTGTFDFEFQVGEDEIPLYRLQRPLDAPPSGGPSLHSALRTQLGLALEEEIGDVEVLVIETVNRVPTPN